MDEHWTRLDGVDVFYRESRGPVDVCVEAVRSADARAADGGLRSLVTALVPVGPQLSFLWRTPSLEVDEDIRPAYQSVDAEILAVLARLDAADRVVDTILRGVGA
jgi:hypothetical protein